MNSFCVSVFRRGYEAAKVWRRQSFRILLDMCKCRQLTFWFLEKLQHYIRLLLLKQSQNCSLQNTAKEHTVEGLSINISGIWKPSHKAIRSLVSWPLALWHLYSSSDSEWCRIQSCASSAICYRRTNGITVEKESWCWGVIPIGIHPTNCV